MSYIFAKKGELLVSVETSIDKFTPTLPVGDYRPAPSGGRYRIVRNDRKATPFPKCMEKFKSKVELILHSEVKSSNPNVLVKIPNSQSRRQLVDYIMDRHMKSGTSIIRFDATSNPQDIRLVASHITTPIVVVLTGIFDDRDDLDSISGYLSILTDSTLSHVSFYVISEHVPIEAIDVGALRNGRFDYRLGYDNEVSHRLAGDLRTISMSIDMEYLLEKRSFKSVYDLMVMASQYPDNSLVSIKSFIEEVVERICEAYVPVLPSDVDENTSQLQIEVNTLSIDLSTIVIDESLNIWDLIERRIAADGRLIKIANEAEHDGNSPDVDVTFRGAEIVLKWDQYTPVKSLDWD